MNRGILKLTREEAKALLTRININKYKDSPLYNKLSSVNIYNTQVEILLSEDELETILDELGLLEKDKELSSAIEKINELIGNLG